MGEGANGLSPTGGCLGAPPLLTSPLDSPSCGPQVLYVSEFDQCASGAVCIQRRDQPQSRRVDQHPSEAEARPPPPPAYSPSISQQSPSCTSAWTAWGPLAGRIGIA